MYRRVLLPSASEKVTECIKRVEGTTVREQFIKLEVDLVHSQLVKVTSASDRECD